VRSTVRMDSSNRFEDMKWKHLPRDMFQSGLL
jgi:hypothetical protein